MRNALDFQNQVVSSIFAKLIKTENGMRFSQLFSGLTTEDDLFNYHLRSLVKKGLVWKEDGLYLLTTEGRIEAQKLNSLGKEVSDYFRISVLMFVVNKEGKILLQRRSRHPFLGDINTPAGKVMSGESFVEAAKRKLKEEAGLSAKFEFRGAFRSTRYDTYDYLVEDTIYHVCRSDNFHGQLKNSEFGHFFWDTFENYLIWQRKNNSAGEIQEKVIKRMRDNRRAIFYWEEVLRNIDY